METPLSNAGKSQGRQTPSSGTQTPKKLVSFPADALDDQLDRAGSRFDPGPFEDKRILELSSILEEETKLRDNLTISKHTSADGKRVRAPLIEENKKRQIHLYKTRVVKAKGGKKESAKTNKKVKQADLLEELERLAVLNQQAIQDFRKLKIKQINLRHRERKTEMAMKLKARICKQERNQSLPEVKKASLAPPPEHLKKSKASRPRSQIPLKPNQGVRGLQRSAGSAPSLPALRGPQLHLSLEKGGVPKPTGSEHLNLDDIEHEAASDRLKKEIQTLQGELEQLNQRQDRTKFPPLPPKLHFGPATLPPIHPGAAGSASKKQAAQSSRKPKLAAKFTKVLA